MSDGRHWGLPKGIVEQGETPEQAAVREVAEETGIPLADLQLRDRLPDSEYVYRGHSGRLIFKRVHHFLLLAPAGAVLHPDVAEIADAAWLDFSSARDRASFRDTVTALDAAQSVLLAAAP